jgi:hypothetical protein
MLKRLFIAIFALLALGGAQAQVPVRHPHGFYGEGVQPLDRILPEIRHGHPGRFYDAEGPFADPFGGWHYRVKWLTPEGRVLWLDADARTGRVIDLPHMPQPYVFGPAPPGYAVPRIYARPRGFIYGGPPRGFVGLPRFGGGGIHGGGGHRGH